MLTWLLIDFKHTLLLSAIISNILPFFLDAESKKKKKKKQTKKKYAD